MKIIIDVPDYIKGDITTFDESIDLIKGAIRAGVVLPKHGDLVDVKSALDAIYYGISDCAYFGDPKIDEQVIEFLQDLPVVVTANKEC